MNRMLVLLVMIVAAIGTATVATAQMPVGAPFRFQLEQSQGPRGLAVEGYVYNALPWRITNVQLQVDSLDANGALIASASGWVVGDVPASGRGYFYVPVSAQATTYRARVQAFDRIRLEAPALQAP